ncbi:hypothetical protein SAMN05421761_11173 [Belliella pelovolcani]|uniref:Uncharacterized protein n=1 Tax=Belliella pelovolcani TaxID=529505 RepID=A0A1N7NQU8_9BACT|nr:hypothetical protein SAMN05421761_11173 [Belliella pelovolcani]
MDDKVNWNKWYWLLIIALAVLIGLFYWLTQAFS